MLNRGDTANRSGEERAANAQHNNAVSTLALTSEPGTLNVERAAAKSRRAKPRNGKWRETLNKKYERTIRGLHPGHWENVWFYRWQRGKYKIEKVFCTRFDGWRFRVSVRVDSQYNPWQSLRRYRTLSAAKSKATKHRNRCVR